MVLTLVEWDEALGDDNTVRSMAKQAGLLGSSAEGPGPVPVPLMVVLSKLELPLLMIHQFRRQSSLTPQ